MNIFQIDKEIAELVDENGEITDLEALEALVMEREKKIENVVLLIKEQTLGAEAMRQEEIALADRRHKNERNIERLKEYLDYALSGQKFETSRCSVSWRHTKVAEIDEATTMSYIVENQLDDLLIFTEPRLARKVITDRLKEGNKIPGATLTEKVSPIIK